jgi:tetratricopeptide (TPR) repeat protein
MQSSPKARQSQSQASPPAATGRLRRAVLVLGGIGVLLLSALVALWVWRWEPPDRQNGLVLFKAGRFNDAEPFLRQTLERKPDDVTVIQALAVGNLMVGKQDEAETYLDRWCRLQPDDPEPFRYRLQLLLSMRRIPEALPDGQHLLELEPNNADVHSQMARVFVLAGRPDEAEREFRYCLERAPRDPELQYLLADVCHSRGKNDDSARLLDNLLHEHPDDSRAMLLRATLYNEAATLHGDPSQAERAVPLLQKVVQQQGRLTQQIAARYQLSLALKLLGKTAEAEKVAAEMEYDQALAQISLALRSGSGEASAQMRVAADLTPAQVQELLKREDLPKMAGLLFRLAESLAALDKADDAVHILQKTVDQEPKFIPAAIRLLEKIAQRRPDCTAAKQLLASCRQKV